MISVLATGCKQMKSDLRSVSDRLTYGYFDIYYKKDKLSTLVCVTIINSFKNIKTDINRISYASYILELTQQVSKEHFDEALYDLASSALLKIEELFDEVVIMNILELKYLDYLGVMPVIDACSLCGKQTSIVTLSGSRGGYICKSCHTNEKIVSDKTIKLIRMFYYVDISKITTLNISPIIKKEINDFLDEYYDRYTGMYLNSKKFLKNLIKL
jgi:DNA repair protein RecO (recombination protein O)